jgi:hypothetical protein
VETNWVRYHGIPGGLSATDPRFKGWVVLQFDDGSHATFQYAFAVEVPDEKSLIVFTEHCGYHRFPLGGLQWHYLGPMSVPVDK